MQTLWQDLRFAVRMLRKNPGFTAVAVLTLAVAIGANAVVFSVMNGLFLRALNVSQSESLYSLEHGVDKDPSESYPDYLDLRDRNRSTYHRSYEYSPFPNIGEPKAPTPIGKQLPIAVSIHLRTPTAETGRTVQFHMPAKSRKPICFDEVVFTKTLALELPFCI
jgi:hypothetical protein